MCTSGAPSAPDPNAIANATTKSNQQTAAYQTGLNAIDQVGPNGSLHYTSTPGKDGQPPHYTATTSYSPGVQKIMDALQHGQQSIANTASQQAAGLGGSLTKVAAPSYTQFGAGPSLNTTGGGPTNVQSSYASGGKVQSNIAGAGPIQRSLGTDDFSGDRQRVEDTLFGELDKQSGKDQASMESELAQQGIARGSAAYTRAMDDFQRSKTANRTSAILSAGQEQNRMQSLALNAGNFANSAEAQQYGQNANDAGFYNSAQAQREAQSAARAGFGNSAQSQKFAEMLQNAGFSNDALQKMFGNRNAVTGANNALKTQGLQDSVTANNQNINQTLALQNGSPVAQPNFGAPPQTGVGGTDTAGIFQNGYNNQMSAYNTNQQQLGGIFGTLGTLGSTLAPYLMSLSDRRAKENVREIGKTNDNQPIYEFNYKGSPQTTIGLMAQEVMKKHPEAVGKIGGLYGVDYKKALRAA
jgi:hypothetical protein